MKKWILIFLLSPIFVFPQVIPHLNAHAHNDYEHDRPLFDALENGFISVEADVHLKGGQILVSHDKPVKGSKTIEKLYLDPLDSLIKKNGGSIYQHLNVPFFLMIDIKTNGEETFKTLIKLLSNYAKYLNTPGKKGAVQIFISGNRPIDLIINDPNHLTAIDGRPADLGKGFSQMAMPVISENYKNIISWNGSGSPSGEELDALKKLAARVHGENKKLRLWNIPDQQNAWQVLLDCGVDLINTDKLRELNLFLRRLKD